MSGQDLHDLLLEATREAPAGVLQPKLHSVHRRIRRRRRAQLAVVAAAVLAVAVTAAAFPLLRLSTPLPPAHPAPAKISWNIAYAEDVDLTIYVTNQPPCTVVEDPQTAVDGGSTVTVTLTGILRKAAECEDLGPPIFRIKVDRVPSSIVDGATGQARPLYLHGDMPTVKEEHGSHHRGYGLFESGEQARFSYTLSGPDVQVNINGMGFVSALPSGEPFTADGINGVIVVKDRQHYFVWTFRDVGYELFDASGSGSSRERLIQVLNMITWG